MAASQAGSSTSFTNSAAGIVAPGGNVTAGDVTVNYYSPSASAVEDFPLPRLIKTFRGRGGEMRALDEAFFSQNKNKVVICGLGGFGKSELAKQYAQRCLDNRKVQRVVWIDSENPKELKEPYTKLKSVYKNCEKYQLIIIFDNCVNQKSIADYEPSDNERHRVLITSQSADWLRDVPIHKLEPLSSDHALQVFRSVLGDKYRVEDEHLYTTLARSVSFIPLGLQIVVSYVEQEDDHFKLTEYVSEIKKSEQNIINEPIPDRVDNAYNKTIYGAMITSIDKIKNKPDQKLHIRVFAHDALCLSAYLRPDYIETKELLFLVKLKNPYCTDNDLNLAIRLLSNYSFLRIDGRSKDVFVQHRTTQASVRCYIRESKLHSVYYKMCIYSVFQERNFYSTAMILSYADSNVTIVHDFYEDNYRHENISRFLQLLIRCECVECIKTIFKNPDEQTKNHINKYNLLAQCALIENVEILKVLLSHVDINSKNDNQETALHLLAKRRDLKGIKLLVRHGADVNDPNAAGDPPLFTIIRRNMLDESYDLDEVFKTLQLKADFSLTNSNNETLLHAAATGQQPGLINFLIKNGLQINQTNNNGWTPLDTLYDEILKLINAYNGIKNYLPILETMLEHGATLNIEHIYKQVDSFGYLLLNSALVNDNLKLLKMLLTSGIDVNSRSHDQQTILHRCAIMKNLEATQIVIEHNADCYVRDCRGDTPLFYFVECVGYNNNMDFLKNMLDLLQCHPSHVDAAGNTILHRVIESIQISLVEVLLTVYEFNVNIQNSNGDTPLHNLILILRFFLPTYYDIKKENIILIIEMFKSYNARLDIKNNNEETPLDIWKRICTEKYSHIINDLSPHLTPAPDRAPDSVTIENCTSTNLSSKYNYCSIF